MVEIEGFAPKTLRTGRRPNFAVVEVSYRSGIDDSHLPEHRYEGIIGVDERYIVAGYGHLSNEQLAELLERYRERYG